MKEKQNHEWHWSIWKSSNLHWKNVSQNKKKRPNWQTVPLFMEAKANIYVNCHQNWKANYIKFSGIISNGSVYIDYKGIMYKI